MGKIATPAMKHEMMEERDHEAEAAADTLMRAHEIKSDPELMSRVKKHATKKVKGALGLKEDIRSIADLKRAAYRKRNGDDFLGDTPDDDYGESDGA